MSVLDSEIASQPLLWRQMFELAPAYRDILPSPGANVVLVGCGSSLHMAEAYAVLRRRTGASTVAVPSSEATMMTLRSADIVVAISRSGTTTETVTALERVAGKVRTVAITAASGSPLAAAADVSIVLPQIDERSVVQTRSATCVFQLLRATVDEAGAAEAIRAAEVALGASVPDVADVDHVVFLGSGFSIGLAGEAALKVLEMSQVVAEWYPAFEYRHGPLVAARPGTVVWWLCPVDRRLFDDLAAAGIRQVDFALDAAGSLVMAQRFAAALAIARGLDPAAPAGLPRSIVLG